ncbi:CoA transferase [Rhodococcus rhodnii]|uniref:Transferase n=2 Tax=Rhodococcus rhodnii TaxID=38312 RepID=R7WI29_9NOCA|nr:CoA transferase [Rhodococcus rhodnii]EOM74827.1 transferase [Rhodococcus rhodnii LMG 5362]TXG90959.1 CoA transferase [Rhodococcus rhodnii]
MTAGALDGLVVADFSRVLAGPYATMMLADMGAHVVKIERPGVGDDTRAWAPPRDEAGTATYFTAVNRNKSSVVLDLADPSGREEALRIVAGADIVVENFRAGTMERLGLGYERLSTVRPGLVYCAITGFGRAGGAELPGYDLLAQAMGGLMSITGPDPDTPTKVGVALVDVLTGMHALAGVLAAIRHRDRTGEGQRVDVDLLSTLLSSLVNQGSAYLGAGVVPTASGNAHPSIAPYELFDTADRPLALAVGTDRQFAALCDVLGLCESAGDDRFRTNADRVAHRGELAPLLQAALRTNTAEHWFGVLTARGIPAGPVNDVAEAIAFADRIGNEPVVEVGAARVRQVANPISLSHTPVRYRSAPPELGEHTAVELPASSEQLRL